MTNKTTIFFYEGALFLGGVTENANTFKVRAPVQVSFDDGEEEGAGEEYIPFLRVLLLPVPAQVQVQVPMQIPIHIYRYHHKHEEEKKKVETES